MQVKHTLGMSLLHKLCEQGEGNFVFSPLSLGMVFAMLAAGLWGGTLRELLSVLGCGDVGCEALHEMYALMVSLNREPPKIASRVVIEKGVEIREEYKKLLKVGTLTGLVAPGQGCARKGLLETLWSKHLSVSLDK